jgi:hypothetical protein
MEENKNPVSYNETAVSRVKTDSHLFMAAKVNETNKNKREFIPETGVE